MTLRRMSARAAGETRRQEARIAALFARPTTKYRPGRCARAAKVLGVVPAVVLLAILMLAFLPLSPFTGSGPSSAAAASLTEQLKDSRARLQEAQDKLAQAQADRKAALGDMAALDQNIESAENEVRIATAAHDEASSTLARLRGELDAVTVELSQKRKELARTERDLAEQQEVFNARVVNIYKSGGSAVYLAGLFDLASISQLIGRMDLLSTIADQDHDILAQIEALKVKIQEQRSSLEMERARASTLEQEQRATTKTLAAETEKKQAALDDLEGARQAKKQVLAAAEQDVAAWSRQEDKLSAESERITADIKAAQAAAEKAAASSDGNGGGGSGSGQFYRPIPGAITSAFGYRMHPIFHVRKMHTGVDMHGGMGTPIHAVAAGTVVSAGTRGGYGKCVVISHGGNLSTLYAHQSTILVSVGQKVTRGQVIGEVGSTGYSTGPHLHFEVRVGGSPVNPTTYL